MKVNMPIIFNQLQESYKNILLGLNTDPKYNFYNYGCTLFSMASALRYYGYNETPETLNAKLIELSRQTNHQFGFVKDSGIYIWGSLNKLFPMVSERRVMTPQALTDAQVNEIRGALDQGYPVLVEVDYNPATLPIEMHFLNIVDYDPADENNMTGADPLGGKIIPMKAYFSWAKFGIRKIIEQYVIISGPVHKSVPKPPEPESTTPAPAPEPTPQAPEQDQPSVPSNPQPTANPVPETPTPPEVAEPSPAVPPVTDPEPTPAEATNATMDHVLASVVDYLEINKQPHDTSFEDIRRVIAGIKSNATDYWNKKEAAEKQLVSVEPTLKSLHDRIGNLEGELTRQAKAHKAEVEAIESTVQSPRNLKRQFDAIYGELKGKHDEYFDEVVELRKRNAILAREIENLSKTQGEAAAEVTAAVIEENPPTYPTVDKSSFIGSIIEGIKSFFVLRKEW